MMFFWRMHTTEPFPKWLVHDADDSIYRHEKALETDEAGKPSCWATGETITGGFLRRFMWALMKARLQQNQKLGAAMSCTDYPPPPGENDGRNF